MTIKTIETAIHVLSSDLKAYFDEDINRYYLEINDFVGFDDEGNEILRDLEKPFLMGRFLERLESECIEKVDCLYTLYIFEGGFSVNLGRLSYEI